MTALPSAQAPTVKSASMLLANGLPNLSLDNLLERDPAVVKASDRFEKYGFWKAPLAAGIMFGGAFTLAMLGAATARENPIPIAVPGVCLAFTVGCAATFGFVSDKAAAAKRVLDAARDAAFQTAN